MKPYLEPRLVACLLLPAPSAGHAWSLIQRFEPPYSLNRLHALQIEGMLLDHLRAPNVKQHDLAAEGLRRWRYFWTEGVFRLDQPAWELALGDALRLQVQVGRQIAGATACLHVGLARVSGATHFVSFERKSREAAHLLGLEVLPESL